MADIDVALIGAGLIARIHLEAWKAVGARVRVYSTDGRSPALAAEFGATAADCLEEAITGAAVVDVCTPTETHRDITFAAVEAGAHVVCEKPLAYSTTEAEEMADAAEAAGVSLYPCHQLRFLPHFSRLRDTVVGGGVGRGTIARFAHIAHHPRAFDYTAPAGSGGILTDPMIHGVDLARWVFGDVTRVHARYRGHFSAPAPEGAVATGTAVLTHAEGAITELVAVWAGPPTPPGVTFCVSGSRGTVECDPVSHPDLRVMAGAADDIPPFFRELYFLTEIREFAEACAGGPEPRVSARDGVEAVRLVEAAAESARTGRAVEIVPKPADATVEGVCR
jgi:predicted dehydrogenase